MSFVNSENNPGASGWLSIVNAQIIPEAILLPQVGESIQGFAFPIGHAARLRQNQWNSWWDPGSQLAEYRTAISNLLEFNKLNQFPSFVVIEAPEAHVNPAGLAFSPGNFDELLPYFAEPVTFSFADFFQPQVLLKWIRNQATVSCLLKQLFHRAKQLAQTVYWTYLGFCGVTWSRRVWFLLHGSHPPKPETWMTQCQAFGCA
jgi:hypothetical protein